MLKMNCATLCAILAFTISAVLAHRCHSQKEICVPVKYCPHTFNSSLSERARGTRRSRDRACYTSEYDDDDDSPLVCCDRTQTSLGKPCRTLSVSVGKCVAPEQCKPIARYLQRNVRFPKTERELEANLCYRHHHQNHYCCPEKLTTPAPKKRRAVSINATNTFPTCKNPNKRSGFCVPVQLCDYIHRSFLNDNIRKDRTLKKFVLASICPTDAPNGYSICCGSRAGSKLIHHVKAAKLGLGACGPINLVDKVYGGQDAGLGEYPWMANLMYRVRSSSSPRKCSGTLIHPRYVLTAAHCMMKAVRPYSVRLGEYNITSDPDCKHGVCKEYAVEKLIPNENFDGLTADYDIALIRLNTSVTLNEDSIYPICLPLTESLLMQRPQKLIITGWGLTEKLEHSPVLQEAELQIVSRKTFCEGESTFCASGTLNGVAHCKGDSGGPYQTVVSVGEEYKYVQFGVISAGSWTCNANSTNVGAMVGYHMNWILDNMDI